MAWTVSGRLPNIPSTGPSAPSVRDVASFPDIEAAAWYHAVPAAVLGDQVRYVRVERRRLYARWIMLFLTFGALIGLTVARYVGSDDELRSVVTLIRDTEPLKMKEKDVANATCPCQDTLIPWGNFTTLGSEILNLTGNNDYYFSFAQCYSFLENNDTRLVSRQEVLSVIDEFEKGLNIMPQHQKIRDDVRKSALWSMCGFMMQALLFDLPSNNYSDTSYLNVFSTPYLATESQVNASWAVYAKTLILSQRMTDMLVYTGIVESAEAVYQESKEEGHASQTVSVYNNTSKAINSIDQAAFLNPTTPYSQQLYGQIFDFTHNHSSVDWTAYKKHCNPQYCDIVHTKSIIFRLTEFLGLIGGLWTTVIAIAMALWGIIDFFSCLGHGESTYKLWHP